MNKIKNDRKIAARPFRRMVKLFQAETDLTQAEIAAKIGCSQSAVSLLLSGKRNLKPFRQKLIDLIIEANPKQVK
jgi:transcriptional regulator with XRE-family HTH domain